jgi:hypothetical protein
MKRLKNNTDMVENIGRWRQLIKPVLDVDAYINDINVWMPQVQNMACTSIFRPGAHGPLVLLSDAPTKAD